jgi:HK97 family phage portal protein
MDAISFWESRVANMDLWGTAYAEKIENRSGVLAALRPIASASITPMRTSSGKLIYEQTTQGAGKRTLPAESVLRISGMSLNGISGLSLVGYHREAIALGLACQRFGAKFFKQGATISGHVEVDKTLGDKAFARLRDTFERMYSGLDNAHKTLILEEGAKFHTVGMPLKDAQFLELQKFTQIDICGIMDVPPHKIGILDHATFSNVEEQNIQWVVDTIAPLAIRISSAVNRQILGNDPKYYAEHVLNSLLRGDILKRYQAFGMGRQWGWLSTNDILRLENMNPVEWGNDDHLRPLNMVPASAPYVPSGESSQASEAVGLIVDMLAKRLSSVSNGDNARDSEKQSIRREAFAPVVLDACRRIVSKECKAVLCAWKKHATRGNKETFCEWASQFYGEYRTEVAENILPPLQAAGIASNYEAGAVEAIAGKFASDYVVSSVASIRDAISSSPDISTELSRWESTKAKNASEQLLSQFPC